ncbi:MAG: hypothetical protein M3458_10620 [Acidobacteriota bacterium]|nr:hypothetical protein [Acidobacteriota bacterium]
MPKLMMLGQSKSGVIEEGESNYFITVLPKGEYKAILGFENARSQNGNIQGYLAFLDADGGNQQTIIRSVFT